jgi:ligand-binding sensor domain-containing protein
MKKITISIISACLLIISTTISAQTFTNYTTSNGLPHNNVNCLVEDTAGNMWFGTQDGIAKFDGVGTWTYFTTTSHPLLVDNVITAIGVDNDNNIWVGTDYGASVFDGVNFTSYTTVDGLGHNRINYINQAANGDIWFGEFSGATVYDGVSFTAYGTGDGLPFGGVNYIDFDSNDDVYMASGLGGFIKYDGTFTIYNTGNGLLSNNVRSITVDAADNKWIGTAQGVSVFDNNNTLVESHTIMYVLPPPDTLNLVVDVKINSLGAVWSGIYVDYLVTVGGVAVYGGAQWDDYDMSDGLVGPVIRKLEIDRNDNVWVATSTGVSKISGITDINDNEFIANTFTVFPNPTNNVLNIVLDDKNKTEESLRVYNTAMQMVKQIKININQQRVSFSVKDLDRGLYFVKHGSQVKKVVVN